MRKRAFLTCDDFCRAVGKGFVAHMSRELLDIETLHAHVKCPVCRRLHIVDVSPGPDEESHRSVPARLVN